MSNLVIACWDGLKVVSLPSIGFVAEEPVHLGDRQKDLLSFV
jgi:hypothetical protein